MVHGLLKWEGELMGGFLFAWGMKWRMGLWWCILKQMANDNYNLFDETL